MLSNITQFNLTESGITREEFDRFERLVYMARETRRRDCKRDEVLLWQVTDQLSDLAPISRKAAESRIKDQGSVGLCFKSGSIWVKSYLGFQRDDVRRTLIHELAHAYVGSQGHGPKWRYVYGVALASYLRGITASGNPMFDREDWIRREVRGYCCGPYTQRRYTTPKGEANPWHKWDAKVKEETNRLVTVSKGLLY